MKIIAVNIGKTYQKMPTIDCARRAWVLDINNATGYKYVVAVVNGEIVETFEIKKLMQDLIEPDKIAFELVSLTNNPLDVQIRSYIASNNINLKGIITKYI